MQIGKVLKILLLEDIKNDAVSLKRKLKANFENVKLTITRNKRSFTKQLTKDWDILIADKDISDMEELEFIRIAHDIDPQIPVIIVAKEITEEAVIAAMKAGACDYFKKCDLIRLQAVILRELALVETRQKAKLNYERQNYFVKITELFNETNSITSTLSAIIDHIMDYKNFEKVGICFKPGTEYENCEFDSSIIISPDSKAIEYTYDLERGICHEMISGDNFSEQSSFYTNDLQTQMTGKNVKSTGSIESTLFKEGFTSLLMLPVLILGEVTGILYLAAKKTIVINDKDLVFFEQVVNMISKQYERETITTRFQLQQEQVSKVLEHSDSIFTILNPDFSLKFVSENVEKILGYTVSELQNNWQGYLTDSSENQEALDTLQCSLESGEFQGAYDVEFYHKNGKRIFLNACEIPIVKDGETVEFVGILRDINKQKESEKEISEQEEQYRNLVEKSRIGIGITDENGKIVFVNDTFPGFFGLSRSEIILSNLENIIHKEDINILKKYELHNQKGENDCTCELRGLHKSGKNIHLELNLDLLEDKNQQVKGKRVYLWDITKRKSQEEMLLTMYNIAQSIRNTTSNQELFSSIRQHLSRIIDTTNLFIALYDKNNDSLRIPLGIDSQGSIEEYPAGKTLTKYVINQRKAVLLDESDMDRLTEIGEIDLVGSPCKSWLGAPLKKDKEIIGVIVAQSYSNSNMYSERDLQMLEFVSDEIASALQRKSMEIDRREAINNLQRMHKDLERKVKENVNELREKDAELLQKRNQGAIGEMISRLAHNWRQPLNAIGVMLQSIEDAWDYEELTEEMLHTKIATTCKILDELSQSIDDYRHFHKSSETEKDFFINDVISEVVNLNISRFQNNNITLNVHLDGKFSVKGYRSEFSGAINNILTNAFNVLIDRKIEKPEVSLTQYRENDEAVISIKDNGGGVSTEIREEIFNLYTTTKKEMNNSGIGLYLSKMIIEKHLKGDLLLINHPEGAEFVIRLKV